MAIETIQRVYFELLQARRARPETTEAFTLKRHNRDLCPELQRRAETVLGCVERHRSIVYDIQGPRDAGADVVVLVNDEQGDGHIVFQVKSDREATGSVYRDLQAQFTQAQNRFGASLRDFYIVLCWDQAARQAIVRQVEQDFTGVEKARVIEPAYAWTFLYELTATQIAALVRAYFVEDDPLLEDLRRGLSSYSEAQVALILTTCAAVVDHHPVTLEELAQSSLVRDAYAVKDGLGLSEMYPLPLGTIIPRDLVTLSSAVTLVEDVDNLEDFLAIDDRRHVSLNLEGMEALMAVAYEAKARFGHHSEQLVAYLFELVTAASADGSTDVERVMTIVDAIENANLDRAARHGVLSDLLAANFPDPGAVAARYGAPLEGWTWSGLADALLRGDFVDDW